MTLIGGLKRNAWGERKGHTIPHHTRKIKKKHKTKKKQPKISIHVYLHSYKLYSCVCLLVWEVHELSHSGHMTVGGWEHNNAALLQAEWDLWLELPQIMVTKVGKGGGVVNEKKTTIGFKPDSTHKSKIFAFMQPRRQTHDDWNVCNVFLGMISCCKGLISSQPKHKCSKVLVV